MKIQILVLITLIMMLPVVAASIDTHLNFIGNGELYTATETLNDRSRLEANTNGHVILNQNTHMSELERKSDMNLDSNYGGARIRTPEYNLRMKGYNLSTGASLYRFETETELSIFPEYSSEEGDSGNSPENEGTHKAINNVLSTVLNAGVFVRGEGDRGTVDREIRLRDKKGITTIGDITFKGQFNFTDNFTLSGIVVRKVLWQQDVNYPISGGDKL